MYQFMILQNCFNSSKFAAFIGTRQVIGQMLLVELGL